MVSGLLGLGAGVFKVLAMDTFMRLPMKVSTTTSNFMIGVTAASAGYYLTQGLIDPIISAPVALGVLLGATIGTRTLVKVRSATVRLLFASLLLFISIRMIFKRL